MDFGRGIQPYWDLGKRNIHNGKRPRSPNFEGYLGDDSHVNEQAHSLKRMKIEAPPPAMVAVPFCVHPPHHSQQYKSPVLSSSDRFYNLADDEKNTVPISEAGAHPNAELASIVSLPQDEYAPFNSVLGGLHEERRRRRGLEQERTTIVRNHQQSQFQQPHHLPFPRQHDHDGKKWKPFSTALPTHSRLY
mmetsp:Transcript_26415/g.40554  ORF Transcript_26415/g.40554 Transcript_26415/m.40554 type:complete len:190 (-) Transcript_26415:49-618(-)